MGLISKTLLIIASFIFFVVLILGGTFLTFSISLSYENVEKETAFIMDLIEDYDIHEILNIEEEISEQQIIEEIYYADYDCDYWDCIGKTEIPLFLISEKSKNYWNNLFIYISLISIALAAILFFLISRKQNFPTLIGILFIFSSFPLWGLQKMISFFPQNIFSNFAFIFFNQSGFVIILLILIGVLFLAIGAILKLFGTGFKIYEFFSRFNVKLFKKKNKLPEKSSEKKEQNEKETNPREDKPKKEK